MRRVGAIALAGAVAAAVIVSSANAALFFLFKPTEVKPGELATLRLGGTPPGFRPEQRVKPFNQPIRLYLVKADDADEVQSRFDRRLSFIGRIVPDRNSRGLLTFTLPPLDTNDYALAYWCPGCARYSFGRAFGVQTVPEVSRYRHLMGLRIVLPPATTTCPVTKGRYGNGFLSTTLPEDGVITRPREPDGTLFDKLGWSPRRGFSGNLVVRGERLDGPGVLHVLSVNWGHTIVDGRPQRGSWRSAVVFPSEGCWRLTGRVGDISLTYVVEVVAV